MGTFTDQVQGLASEKKLARLEREQRQKDKKRQEENEKRLFYLLDEELTTADDKKQKYVYLSNNYTRMEIIEKITNNNNDVYILLKKYNSILNLAYNAFKEEIKQQEAEQKELEKIQKELEKNIYIQPAFTIEEYLKHTQPKIKIDKMKILYIVLLPLLCIIWFLQGLTGTKRRR